MKNISSWEDIDKDSKGMITNLTYTVLFINDQIYNWSLILHDELSKTNLYKQRVKQLCKQINRITNNYNSTLGCANISTVNKTALAVITASMEEDVSKHIEVYKYTISNILLSKGIVGDKNKIASIASTLNMLA